MHPQFVMQNSYSTSRCFSKVSWTRQTHFLKNICQEEWAFLFWMTETDVSQWVMLTHYTAKVCSCYLSRDKSGGHETILPCWKTCSKHWCLLLAWETRKQNLVHCLSAYIETLFFFFSLTSSYCCLVIDRVENQVFEIFQNEGSILLPLKSD